METPLSAYNTHTDHVPAVPDGFRVTVTRKPQYMDKHVPMQILINGTSAGHLKNGESKTYLISGDQGDLQAALDMNKTAPYRLSAAAGNLQHFCVASRMTNPIFVIGTILVILSAGLVLWTQELIYMILAAPPALYHVYLRFIHKDKYLIIREEPGH